jgi:large repetitive protein
LSSPRPPGLALVADTGRSRSDRITSNGAVRVFGLLPGAIWQFSLNSGSSWRTGSGTSFLVKRGTYARGQVQVRQRSRSGKFSRANTGFAAFTVDTVAVVPRLFLLEDTGSSRRDRITSNGTVRVSGLEEGATWQFSLNAGTSWRNGSGTTFLVPDGSYSAGQVRVRQRDLAGNLSAEQIAFAAFTVDTQAAEPRLALAADTGTSASDRITNNGTLNVLGLEEGAA